MYFEQIFHNLTVERMNALRKKIQVYRRFFFQTTVLGTCSLKQIMTMTVKIKLLYKFHFVCFDINERYGIG